MTEEEIINLIKKIESGKASVEEKTTFLNFMNSEAKEYIDLLKERIKELETKST